MKSARKFINNLNSLLQVKKAAEQKAFHIH